MSDFRTKLLGLAAVATAFTGMSYGQVVCNNAVGQLIQPTSNVGFLLRAEGETEQVSSTVFTCPTSNPTAGVTVEVTLSLPVTSKAVAVPFSPGGNSEATLIVTDNAVDGGTHDYSGFVSGNLITFSNVTFPANFTATLVDVRVNASLSPGLTSVVPVTEQILLGQNGIAEYAPGPITVGQVLRGLAPPTIVNSPNGLFLSNGNNTGIIPVCTGDVIGTPAPAAAFNITVNEGFPGAFKLQTDPAGNVTNQEQAIFVNPGNGVGTANSATQITLTFGNVPAGATLYVPTIVSFLGPNGVATLTLSSSQVAATSPIGLTKIPAANLNGPVAALPAAVGGVVTALYTVTATNALQQENFTVPVYLNIAAGTATTPLAPQGAITILESLAPSGPLPASGLANSVPLFAVTTNTPINLHTITVCQTTLLFPFVTNSGTFETGIAIANTSTDNLGTVTPGASVSSPTNGSCALNFYGNAAQPKSATFPPTGTIGAFTASPAQGPTYADTLSDLIGTGTNFTGYVIAQCNFLEAHGFAFITDYGNSTSGYAEGYLGIVVPNGRGEQLDGTVGHLTEQ